MSSTEFIVRFADIYDDEEASELHEFINACCAGKPCHFNIESKDDLLKSSTSTESASVATADNSGRQWLLLESKNDLILTAAARLSLQSSQEDSATVDAIFVKDKIENVDLSVIYQKLISHLELVSRNTGTKKVIIQTRFQASASYYKA